MNRTVRCFNLLIFIAAAAIRIFPQDNDVQFEHLMLEDGLSQSSVFCMLQDHQGFMWFGTANGLNKYDGYNFTIYTHNPNNPNSLSNDWINAILEDRDGDLWIGTQEGLSRLARHKSASATFINYKRDPANPNSLSHNYVHTNAILEDRDGRIWIGTPNGLNYFDKTHEAFSRFTTQDGLKGNRISTLCEGENGNLLIGFYEGGISVLSWLENGIPQIKPLKADITVNKIFEDRNNDLWFGTTDDGVYKFERATKTISHYKRNYPEQKNTIIGNSIRNMLQDQSGALWILTGSGVSKMNIAKERFTNFQHDPYNPYSIRSNNMMSIWEDRSGILWFGSTLGGIDKLIPHKNRMQKFTYNPYKLDGFKSKRVYSFCEDPGGLIWIGAWFNMAIYDRNTGRFATLSDANSRLAAGTENVITALYTDRKGYVWIGSTNSGLYQVNPKALPAEQFFQSPELRLTDLPEQQRRSIIVDYFEHHSGDPVSISSSAVRAISEDANGDLWIATLYGLNHLNYSEFLTPGDAVKFTRYLHKPGNPNSLSNNQITSIYVEAPDTVWAGTQYNGLNRLVTHQKDAVQTSATTVARYGFDADDTTSLSHNSVYSIYKDGNHFLWVATYGGGLNRFDPQTETFIRYTETDGLPNNVVYGILPDDHGNLWLSTNRGLSRFDPSAGLFKNYDVHDGLQSNEFNTGAYFKSPTTGELFFGGINGFNMFHPDSLQDNPHTPPVILTDLKLFNQSIFDEKNQHFSGGKPLSELAEIVLPYDQNFLSFDFVALDFTNPLKNEYAYQLEGIDPDWVYCGNRRFVSYTNIPAGDYVFRVKGANSNGVWNEDGVAINITITPPFWQTAWFRVLAIVAFISLIFGGYHLRIRQLNRQQIYLERLVAERTGKLQNRTLELERQKELVESGKKTIETQAAKLLEMDRIKTRFFANISHEFRTPLTLILSPLEEMLSASKNGSQKNIFKMMRRNARRLLRLINQLLDITKLETGKMALHPSHGDLVAFLKTITDSFIPLAKEKQIHLQFNSSEDSIITYFDRDKVEKVVYNLLSNAVKFTSAGGKIEVIASAISDFRFRISEARATSPEIQNQKPEVSDFIEITVKDTGIGIPADRLPHIFDRFYQIDDFKGEALHATSQQGTGIGLALVKELITLHHGAISVNSTEGQGTEFIVRLPLGRAQSVEGRVSDEKDEFLSALSPQPFATNNNGQPTTDNKEFILIVEDNADVRTYLRNSLSSNYQLIEAINGSEGIEKAKEHIPDLIISDVMMPEMDGFEFCRITKQNLKTSHIPIIILTAKVSDANKLIGLETGADDYLTKPFSLQELKVRIHNLIEQRRKLREKFSTEFLLKPNDITVSSPDAIFLRQISGIIEANMANPDLTIEEVAAKLEMSRKQLHRKLRALTDQSPSQFIRSMRLQRAKQLLEQNAGNITEIAFNVGFGSSSYFTRCFREVYGVLPSEVERKTVSR